MKKSVLVSLSMIALALLSSKSFAGDNGITCYKGGSCDCMIAGSRDKCKAFVSNCKGKLSEITGCTPASGGKEVVIGYYCDVE